MQSSDLQVRRLDSARDAAFEQLLEIYNEANEPSERKSRARLETMIQVPGYYFLVGIESSRVVGYSILRALDDSDAALLEYLAVARDRRNQGIGRVLLAKTVCQEPFVSRFLLAEVGSDKEPGPELWERRRRKAFYRRLGWKEIEGLEYIMPPVSGTSPPNMDMLIYHQDLPAAIERALVRAWLQSCYVEVYGQAMTDPRIDAMLGRLPEQIAVI